jgi:hypothetical protein
MSDENKFFRFVWRLNAVLLLLGILAVGAVVGVRIAWPDFDIVHWKQVKSFNVLEAIQAAGVAESYTLEQLDQCGLCEGPGPTEKLYAVVRHGSGTNPVMPWAQTSQKVNVAVLDDKKKASRWLFPKGERAILSATVLYKWVVDEERKTDTGATTQMLGTFMVVVETDSNKDGRLDNLDRQSLYAYRFDGKPVVRLLTADRIITVGSPTQTDKYRVVYQTGNTTIAVTYSAPDFVVLSEIPIADMPKLQDPLVQPYGISL